MVRSPWKLLTGLLSRRKAADQHDVGEASFTEIPIEFEGANSTAAEASIGGESAPEPKPSAALQAGKGEAGDRQEPLPSKAAEAPDPMPADEATALGSDRTVVSVGAKRRTLRDKASPTTRSKAKAEAPVRVRYAEPAITLEKQAATSTTDPVRALDREIRDLRSQLAGKLQLQNDQLRQMLRRFEPK
ncbi:hypothetical protein [Sinorhizobium sp. RAC02]|mgnify:CR=1 FL=1|uniref:hypothetical protein n=1 Tax=Sinorhizobium sp. RAC02 TaxID=1842534 RepID=UPI00083D8BC5|nr:hypothetical protein [Sinorhizobium sp. RAC02]AOF93649.1 hypothetical protein BSY16_4259 [Sinorhizobium sp. RAC02]